MCRRGNLVLSIWALVHMLDTVSSHLKKVWICKIRSVQRRTYTVQSVCPRSLCVGSFFLNFLELVHLTLICPAQTDNGRKQKKKTQWQSQSLTVICEGLNEGGIVWEWIIFIWIILNFLLVFCISASWLLLDSPTLSLPNFLSAPLARLSAL